jgi:hypothetical protein
VGDAESPTVGDAGAMCFRGFAAIIRVSKLLFPERRGEGLRWLFLS